jgi:membrane protease YdiL (CAAX protease family)
MAGPRTELTKIRTDWGIIGGAGITEKPTYGLPPEMPMPRAGYLEVVRRHPLASFFVLAYLMSWSYWIPLALTHTTVAIGSSPSHFPGLLGPAIAAFVVTAIAEGRAGVRNLLARMGRWGVGIRWYLMAVLPLIFFLVGAAARAAAGYGWPSLAGLGRFGGVPWSGIPVVFLALFLANSMGEETGWRGFATPGLQRTRGPIAASLILAVFWATWHVPTFFVIQTYKDLGPAFIPGFFLGMAAGAIVLTWLYNASGSSILIVSLWHAFLNLGSGTQAAKGSLSAFVSTMIVLWAVLIVVREVRGRRVGRSSARRRNRAGNRFVALVLRSPLHPLLSRSLALITVRGRRTGREYELPVMYAREGDELILIPGDPERKTWWKNLQGGAPVRLRLRGQEIEAMAEAILGADEPDAVAEALAQWLPRFTRGASSPGLHRYKNGEFYPADLQAAARRAVVVRIKLGAGASAVKAA